MSRTLLVTLMLSCTRVSEPETCESLPTEDSQTATSERLFGVPNATTGLTDAQCGPVCSCGDEAWSPPNYTEDDFAQWRSMTLVDAPSPSLQTPYGTVEPITFGEDAVCAVILEDDPSRYRLQSFDSTQSAARAGARPTHFGACGLCSSLQDLAVYASIPDLTDPVRACGLQFLTGPPEAHVQCLLDLGFSEPCAWIWYHNTLHTRRECMAECFSTLDDPYHHPDGALNACLQCDEDTSGPVFHTVAGRTRRNTGLASSMCRPCAEVRPLVHDYGL
jgi:hypothetical protein